MGLLEELERDAQLKREDERLAAADASERHDARLFRTTRHYQL